MDSMFNIFKSFMSIDLPGFPKGYDPKAIRKTISQHESWSDDNLDKWKVYPIEEFSHDTLMRINLQNRHSAEEIQRSIQYAVKQILNSNPTVRQKLISWEF